MSEHWTADHMPDLAGRTVVVTGANSGLGYEASLAFARKGARVVMACRDPGRADTAREAALRAVPGGSVDTMPLDLASLASVRDFAKSFLQRERVLDVLVNNAGVMALPFRKTVDGFEMQFGTNHLGPFALTGLLLERLLGTPGARIVTVSSTAHRIGRIRFGDLQWERGYSKWAAYGRSKLANLLFTYELDRRLRAAGANALAAACHPGYAATNLQATGPRMHGSALRERGMLLMNRLFSQSAAMGALPTLYAATSPDVRGGDYIGPDGFMEIAGHPKRVASSRRSRDPRTAARLFEVSEELTGVRFDAITSTAAGA